MITLVDYGAGNLRSVANTLDAVGASYQVTNQPAVVAAAERIILPGVGHFGQMMRAIDDLALRPVLLARIAQRVPFLGICVGLQCLFDGSEESPGSAGLAVLSGTVRRFQGVSRVPHMGWNSLAWNSLASHRPSRLLQGLPDETYTYFAHSYYAPVVPATAATCTYGVPYSAILEQNNLCAVQFHPEKSGSVGQQVIRNFLALC